MYSAANNGRCQSLVPGSIQQVIMLVSAWLSSYPICCCCVCFIWLHSVPVGRLRFCCSVAVALGASACFHAGSNWQLLVKSSWWWALPCLRRCASRGRQSNPRPASSGLVPGDVLGSSKGDVASPWRGLEPGDGSSPCGWEWWLLFLDSSGSRDASLSGWCPSCSNPDLPVRPAEMEKCWDCGSLCDSGTSAPCTT